MSCLCIDDLRPASFRGVSFYVANDKGEYGRRNITHEYPMRDNPYIEDMGQKATKFSVNGYLFGDDWIAQKDAIVAACTARGPAILQLPTEAAVMVACNTLGVSRSKDECGFYTLTFEFVVATQFGSPPSAVGALESQIGAVFNAAIPALTAYFDQNYKPNDVLQYVVDNQTSRLVTFTSNVISTAEGNTSTDQDTTTAVVQTAISMFQNAEAYTQPDSTSSAVLCTQPLAAAVIAAVANDTGITPVGPASGITVSSGAAAVVPMIAAALNGIGDSMTGDVAIAALMPFAQWSVNEVSLSDLEEQVDSLGLPVYSPVSPSDTANAVNGTVFCGMVRSFALMKLAQAIAAQNFSNRQDAIQARANIVELFNVQIEQFSEDEIVDILLQARDLAVQAVTQKMTTLVSVLTINAPMSKPSLYWASRLYSDVYRAQELADRNNVSLPGFMPNTFEALAR